MSVLMHLWPTVSAPSTPASCCTTNLSGAALVPSCLPTAVSPLTLIPDSDDNDEQTPELAHTTTPPVLLPCHQSNSDLSSDYEYYTSHPTRVLLAMSSIPNQIAAVEHLHVHQSKSPILLAGEIDPVVMCMFKLGCLDFFNSKEIKEDDQVCKILGCFRDSQIHNWISRDCNQLLTLSFPDFMAELRANYLDPDLELTICHCTLTATLEQNQPFWDWFLHMQSLNSLLANTTSYFSDTSLHEKLEVGWTPNSLVIAMPTMWTRFLFFSHGP